jgi:negative regulator of sigma E activity
VKENYNIRSTGKDVISGRSAVVVVIKPREKGTRPSFKIWIDHETGLPLKTETYTIDGSLSFLSTLSGVAINPSFPQDYFVIMVPRGTKAFEPPATLVKNISNPAKKTSAVKILPLKGGYYLKDTSLSESGNLQSIYHDGINSISVFSEDLSTVDSGGMKSAKRHKGVLNNVKLGSFEGFFCSRNRNNILSFISGSHRYIVVGEVSKKGLIDIAIDLKAEFGKNEN